MKYLCVGYLNKAKMDAVPKKRIDEIMKECGKQIEELYARKEFILDLGLDKTATSVRTRSGKHTVSDGPFVETKEVLGSAFLIEAETIEEAVRVASLHPAARGGEEFGWGIEVHPVHFYKEA